jgi:3'-5' exoribonuclease
MIKDLTQEQRIKDVFLVSSVSKGITNKGTPYYSLVLQDSSGKIDAKKWDVIEGDENVFKEGELVEVEADVLDYRGKFQLKIISGTNVDTKLIDPTLYVEAAPVARKTLQDKLFQYIEEIKDVDYKKIVDDIVRENFMSLTIYPAASKHHHAYACGLLHHTVSMLDLAKAVGALYPTLNMDLLYSGVILHDIGKIKELSGPVATRYTLEGKLLGHTSIAHSLVKEVANKNGIEGEKIILLEHMVLAHHGKMEFGAPMPPAIFEAEVLSTIDDLDAKMNAISKALDSVKEGEFTPRIMALEDRSFYKYKKD